MLGSVNVKQKKNFSRKKVQKDLQGFNEYDKKPYIYVLFATSCRDLCHL